MCFAPALDLTSCVNGAIWTKGGMDFSVYLHLAKRKNLEICGERFCDVQLRVWYRCLNERNQKPNAERMNSQNGVFHLLK